MRDHNQCAFSPTGEDWNSIRPGDVTDRSLLATPSLTLPPEVVRELRHALLADLRSLAEGLRTAVGQLEPGRSKDEFKSGRAAVARRAKAIREWRDIHEAIGRRDDPLGEVRVTKMRQRERVLNLLIEHRDGQAARVLDGTLDAFERDRTIDRVRLLTDFLRHSVLGLAR